MSITSESWWGREANAPMLVDLGAKLRANYGLSAGAIGIKGNTAHTQGYHRSANWVRNSAYCTNTSYSVTETPGNRNPADADWCCALDVTLPRAELIAACERLDEAVRAGRLEKITEWYGNDDGDQRVDGYDNIRNRVASSDDSHLWHLHMSFDRTRVAEDHTDVYETLTGENMALTPEDIDKVAARTVQMLLQKDLTIPEDWKTQFPDDPTIQDGTIGYDTCVRSGYFHSRQANEDADVLLTELEEIKAMLAAMPGGTPLPPAGATVSVTGTLELTPVEPTEPPV